MAGPALGRIQGGTFFPDKAFVLETVCRRTWSLHKIWLIVLVFHGLAASASPFPVDELQGSTSLGPWLEYLDDEHGELSAVQVFVKKTGFFATRSEHPTLGISSGVLWVRVALHHGGDTARQTLLEYDHGPVHAITLWRQGESEPGLRLGPDVPPETRPVRYRRPVFPPKLEPGENIFDIRLDTSIKTLQFRLWDPAAFAVARQQDTALVGLLFGAFLMMLGYNLLLAMVGWHRALHWYLLTLGLAGLQQFMATGVLSLFFNVPWLMVGYNIVVVLLCWASIVFLMNLLDIPRLSPSLKGLREVVFCLELCALLIVLWTSLSYPYAGVHVVIICGVFTLTMYVYLVAHALRRGSRPARFCVLAGLPPLVAGVVAMMMDLGLLPVADPTLLILGSLVPMALFYSLAVIIKLRDEREDVVRRETGIVEGNMAEQALRAIRPPAQQEFQRIGLASWYGGNDRSGCDLFYVHEDRERQRFYAVTGDVTGPGTSGVILTGTVYGAARSLVESMDSSAGIEAGLQHMAERLNQIVLDAGRGMDRYMTMALICIDLATMELHYLNAGHPPVWLLDEKGHRCLSRPGSLIGFGNRPQFGYLCQPVRPGDTLLCCSNGLEGNQGPEGQRLRLSAVVRRLESREPRQIVEALSRESHGIWQDDSPADEAGLLALQIKTAA